MNAPPPPLAALIQMTSGIDPDANLATIDRALAEAAARGAAMAFLPEMSLLLDRDRARSGRHITRETDRSEEHTSELQSLMRTSYADFCLKKKQQRLKSITLTNYKQH